MLVNGKANTSSCLFVLVSLQENTVTPKEVVHSRRAQKMVVEGSSDIAEEGSDATKNVKKALLKGRFISCPNQGHKLPEKWL